jgi:hypothetical protein
MSPYHLEILLILRCNADLWNFYSIEEIMRDGSASDIIEEDPKANDD